MTEKDYVLQPLEELVSKQLEPVGRSRRFREDSFSLWENIEFYALLPLGLYGMGKGIYGLIMSNNETVLKMGDAVQTAIGFFR